MMEPANKRLSIREQAKLQSINRSNSYRKKSKMVHFDADVLIMNCIDQFYAKHPYYGYRRTTVGLWNNGWVVNKKRSRRLMRKMGLYAIYPKRNLSKLYHAQYIRPYLLRNLAIDHPNQVWGAANYLQRVYKFKRGYNMGRLSRG
jgi:putative transposase